MPTKKELEDTAANTNQAPEAPKIDLSKISNRYKCIL
jgi:hypothetical protein